MKHGTRWRQALLGATLLFAIWPQCLRAEETMRVWQTFPWFKEAETQEPGMRAMMPAEEALAQMADAEYEPVCLFVWNPTDAALKYGIDVTALAKALPNADVEVLSSWVTPIRYGDPRLEALKTIGADTRFGHPHDVGDPLLPVTEDRVLLCPAGEGRSVWLILHTHGTEAGVYKAPIAIRTRDGIAAQVELTVQVWPLALPKQLEVACYHWDYGCSVPALTSMREHKVNTFMISDLPEKFTLNDDGSVSGSMSPDRLAMKKKVIPWAKFVGSYGFFADYMKWAQKNKIQYMSPKFKDVFKKAIQFAVAELKEAGIGYQDFWFQHIDEANGEKAQQIAEMGPVAREADPKVRWALTVMSNMADIKKMAPYTDLIMYRGEAYWSDEQVQFYKEWEAKGNPIWQFKQMGMYRGEPQVHMHNRLRQWRTWLNGWNGSATFVYSACPYNWQNEPITVRHWEAIRETNEDYQYFAMVKRLAKKVEAKDKKRAAAAIKLVDDLVQGLIGPTAPGTGMLYAPEHAAIMLYPYTARVKLVQEIVALRKFLGENVPEVDLTIGYRPDWLRRAPRAAHDGKNLLNPLETDLDAAQLPEAWTPGGRNIGLMVAGRTDRGALTWIPVEGKWVQDEWYAHGKSILEPGQTYTVSFAYQWPEGLAGGSVQIEGTKGWRIQGATGEVWKAYKQTFTLPAAQGLQDLNLRLKEFRLRQGNEVSTEALWRNLMVRRQEPVANLPGPAAPRFGYLPASGQEPAALRLIAPNTYAPVWWQSAAVKLEAGCRYQLRFRYRTWGTIHRAVQVESTKTRKARKGRTQPVSVPCQESLIDTQGEWYAFSRLITVPRDGEYRVRLFCGSQQAPDADGKPRPAKWDAAEVSLAFADTLPLRRALANVEIHCQHLSAQTKAFSNRNDPVLKALAASKKKLQDLEAQVQAAAPGSKPSPAQIMSEIGKIRRDLNKRPLATWIAPVQELPLPSQPPSSEIAFGLSKKGKLKRVGKQANPMDAAAIGIANLSDTPLCFMIHNKSSKAPWALCQGFGAKGKEPKRYKPEVFLKRFGWCEFVVAPGETRYIWVSKSGRVELLSMDNRVPGILFDVKIEEGLGL